MSSSSWSAERIDTLRRLWREGRSAAQIAKALGDVTRNAVIGKIHRLGLAGRTPPSPPRRSRPVRQARRTPSRTLAKSPPPPPSSPRAMSARVRRPAKPSVEAVARIFDLTALTSRTCHWPVGDPRAAGFGFCGLAVRGAGPYCAGHHAVACPPRLKRQDGVEAGRTRRRSAALRGWDRG
ncbi:GcrA family cell cycle regulator [Caulobacter rhizosphaerae]|uniref:GcrA family cell cycle regulator n=1 Tax=Caulobacter rhizosphaerae TaxID=2010972 RepID=UPI0013D5E01E|nr:GcrA family cell cycle regulator [Caulobacter rhizosphaerae]GGL35880.1 hypothetical protein GCM10010983_36150 [Caulobacter rhizosphaerae]